MARTHFNLPSLNALDAFEAAARHLSFKRGASELNVSPSAVSHQVRALEADLGVSLFERNNRGVKLSRDGSSLYTALEHGFGHIAQTTESLRRSSSSSDVQVMATTAMSHLWLTPRLGRFWRQHATVTVNQRVSDMPWTDEPYDLLVRYGDMAADSGDCHILFKDHLCPMTSIEFARANQIDTLEELAQLPLIHLNAPDRQWSSWKNWLGIMGYKGPVPDGLNVNNYVIALQAAQDGMGVVLGWKRMTAPLLRSGALQCFTGFKCIAPREFYIRKSSNAAPYATLLRDWLVQAARDEEIGSDIP